MISVSEAKTIIAKAIQTNPPTQLPLSEAAGLVLSADIFAPVDIPAFPQSSMDGYAFGYDGWKPSGELSIIGEMAAGDRSHVEMRPGNAIRIFTGAAVPPGADTVVMQEKVKAENQHLLILDEKLRRGSNVRPQGSEIRKNELALPAGTLLTPAAIGFLAGLGINEVSVFSPPDITIIITGNELQLPGEELAYGQVYDSNSFALVAALASMNFRKVQVTRVKDNIDHLSAALQIALNASSMVLLVGGISVGDYDFVLKAATRCGILPLFHKIKQRPGKPLYFGTRDQVPVFGLPGNPSSALTCFYLYVLPALEQMTGQHVPGSTEVPLKNSYQKERGLTHFLKGHFDGTTASILDAQESFRLRSFARSNCLIQIDEDDADCAIGKIVTIHHLAK